MKIDSCNFYLYVYNNVLCIHTISHNIKTLKQYYVEFDLCDLPPFSECNARHVQIQIQGV